MVVQLNENHDIFDDIQKWICEYHQTSDNNFKKDIKKIITVTAMPFVKDLAYGIARRSTDPVDDLIQVGAIGLLKAIDLFNPKFGSKFKSYATFFITGEIKHYLRDKASMIKPPRDICELSYRINHLLRGIDIDGSDISAEKIANLLCVPVKKVNDFFEVNRRKKVLSLDEIIVKDDDYCIPLLEKLPSDDTIDLLDMYEEKVILKESIDMLDDKLKKVINMIFFEDMNQRQVADELKISQMQVSRRLRTALDKLYDIIKSDAKNGKVKAVSK